MSHRLGLLGEIEFRNNEGQLTPLTRSNQRRLVAVLGSHYRQPVASDWLADLLELTPGGLRTRIRRIRERLGDDAVVTQASGYRLGDLRVDVEEFEAQRHRARQLEATERADALIEALQIWRGEALNEFAHESWAAGEAARLNELRSTALDDLAETYMQIGRFSEAIAALEAEVLHHPFRDRTRRLHMTALARAGRTPEALRAFQEYRTFLIDETGTEPPTVTRELEQRILARDLDLDEALVSPAMGDAPPPPGVVITLVAAAIEPDAAPSEVLIDLREQQREQLDDPAQVIEVSELGFVAKFDDPIGAVGYAEQLQRTRVAAVQGSTEDFGLSIGIHSGLGTDADGVYLRTTIDGADRVRQAASPGSVLMSSTTAELVAPHGGFTLLPRGHHRLHDGSALELTELVWDQGAVERGRLRTITDTPTNVPVIRPKLIGRNQDLAAICTLVEEHRLITIVAPGGSGKSAIAIETAASLLPRYPHGAFVVELAAIDDPALITNAIVRSLGLRADTGSHSPESLAAALQGQRALVVIDNAEHMLDHVADLVEALVAVDGPTFLVTSREWLDVSGEQTYFLPRLTARAENGRTHGAALFLANAAAAGVRTDALDDHIIEELCARLDHLPLALELAAGAAIHLSPEQIIGSLERGERLRATRRRNRSRRFTSVDEMLDGSFDLLDADERSLLLTLGVFRGPTLVNAIEGLWDRSHQRSTAEVLGNLVLRSLVVAQPHGHDVTYHLLETVRDFVRDRAATADSRVAVRRAHRDWFLEWSTPGSLLDQYASTERARQLQTQLPNLREAMQFSADHGEATAVRRQAAQMAVLWFTFLHGDEGLRWFGVGERPIEDHTERLHHLMGKLTASFASEQWGTAIDVSSALARECGSGDRPEMALGSALVAVTQIADSNLAFEWIETAEKCDARFGHQVRPLIDHLAGDLYVQAGEYHQAIDRYDQALDALDREAFAWFTSSELIGIGLCRHLLGQTERACAPIEEALELARSMPDSLGGITRGVVAQSVVLSALGQHRNAHQGLLNEIERNERRTASIAIRAEPVAAALHLAIDANEHDLATRLWSVSESLGLKHRSPWQRLLITSAADRLTSAGMAPSPITPSIDEALEACRAFLHRGATQ